MQGPDPTFEWYFNEYLRGAGGVGEAEFDASLPAASARVRRRLALFDPESLEGADLEAYRRAVCAACEAVSHPAVTSYSAGKASETFADGETMTADAAIERELAGSRLACSWA